MSDNIFHVGQYVEFLEGQLKGEEAIVWEVGDDHLGLILCDDELKPEVTPLYVSHREATASLRPLRPKQKSDRLPSRDKIPAVAELAYHTTNYSPRGQFDFHDIIVSTGQKGPVLDVLCSRMSGIFPASFLNTADLDPDRGWDGTWSYFRVLAADEWKRIQDAFGSLGFWSLPFDDAVRTSERGEYWTLLAYQRGEQHEVWRCYTPNDIETFCRLLFSIAEQPGLLRGDSSMLP